MKKVCAAYCAPQSSNTHGVPMEGFGENYQESKQTPRGGLTTHGAPGQ
ncbi:unnamed protein product [Staurois parvus]|uniref:Uncharacterized protein n=1 Tax=Staurois parvus TaxID=386267 RepID=A0ABN9DAE0_9NEOB|nr:unnamed protein product [Staurois parvus]